MDFFSGGFWVAIAQGRIRGNCGLDVFDDDQLQTQSHQSLRRSI
ncbi:MAG: hypothetical protein AAF685_13470 [Cyanobacteria bacterium P01_C01_bin.89]